MKRKCLTIGIILLFVGTCIIPAIAQNTEKQSSRGNWLYVGGSGPGNYTRIQDAIDNASDGDTVFVYDDSSPYYENIVINKTISLIGENRNTTVIDGMSTRDTPCIKILANYVTINNFCIQNTTDFDMGGVWIRRGHNCVISNNTIVNNYYGIYIFDQTDVNVNYKNQIKNNNIHDCIEGINIAHSSNDLILNNNISNCGEGMTIWVVKNLVIRFNNIVKNEYASFDMFNPYNISITENNIQNNITCGYNAFFFFPRIKIDSNYWGKPKVLPKVIFGIKAIYLFTIKGYIDTPIFLLFPSIILDRHPTREPYNIPAMS